MFNFCFYDLQCIKPNLRDIIYLVLIFISRWTSYDASIQFNILLNKSAQITLILSMVWFRNCNSILSFFLSCSFGDLTQLKKKETAVPTSVRAHLVIHKSFAMMELKYYACFLGRVGGSGLTSCVFLCSGDDTFVESSSSEKR